MIKSKNFIFLLAIIIILPAISVYNLQLDNVPVKDPIFGYINFMPDIMIDSMLGGKYAHIKHPYLYLSTGKSVKCYEPATGKLIHTVPFDSSKEKPWEATDEGVTFSSNIEGVKYCRLGRYDGTDQTIPLDEKVYYVSWGTRPLLVYLDKDCASNLSTFEAKDLGGKIVWKIERIKRFERWYVHHFWIEIDGRTSLFDMQTGKVKVTIPEGYSFVSSMGQFAQIISNARFHKKEYASYSLVTNKVIHESSNINFYYGDDEVLYCSKASQKDTPNCYELLRININGEITEKKLVTIPFDTNTVRFHVASFYKNLVVFNVVGAKQKLVVLDTLTEKVIAQMGDVQYSKFFENKLFYVGRTVAGCFDALTFQNIWTTTIGNSNKPDVYQEKDFGKYKLVGRHVQSSHKDSPYALQVRMINKTDGSVEPAEFFFEYGSLKNLYETDYGFVNINTSLITEHTNYPQISFYRIGSTNPIGSIDNIGLISLHNIVVRDGRYLVADTFDKELEIDCRLMTYTLK